MTDRGRRFGKGIAIALAVHIIAAALLGILGYRFKQRPPQIFVPDFTRLNKFTIKHKKAFALLFLLLLRCSSKNSSLRR